MGEPDVGMIVIWCAIWGAIGGMVGASKSGGPATGVFLGVLLGPIGVLIVAASKGQPEPTVLERVERRPDTAGWHPDPLGRFDARYYDGTKWSQHVGRVAADGTRQQFEDPV